MASYSAVAFDGQLNSNEIYSALFNLRILFQKLAPQTVRRDEIIALLDKAVGMYGDTGVLYGMDITGTYDFENDAEASKLLAINRNKSQKIEKFTIDHWRQTDVTVDAYLSKRAFLDEGNFAIFNGYLVGTLSQNFDAFETGFVKASLGTYVSPIADCNINVTMPAADGTEATERIRAAAIKKAIMDLEDDMKDNQRKYNGYGFYGSYDWNDMTPVFNSKYVNEINAQAIYQTFNPEFLRSANGARKWTPKWFGTVAAANGKTNATNNNVYSLIEQNSDGTKNLVLTSEQQTAGVYRIFPGDLLPNSFNYLKGEAYTRADKVIAKIFFPEYIYYMTGYEQGEMFHNARSGTDNHYLRKGHSDVMVSKFRPFITLTEINPSNGSSGS